MTEPSPVIPRLIALLHAGYVLNQSGSRAAGDRIWLEHPAGKRARESTLFLAHDGCLIGWQSGAQQLRIGPNDADGFGTFVSGVPQATWWERLGNTRYTILGWALFIVLPILLGIAMQVIRDN